MLASLLITAAAIVGGTVATYRYDPGSPPIARVFTGACTGYGLLALVGFLAAWVVGLGTTAIAVATIAVLAPTFLLVDAAVRTAVGADLRAIARDARGFVARPSPRAILFLLCWGAFAAGLWLIFDRVIFERPDGIYTGYVNNLGDLPFHIQIVASFAHGANFPPEHPAYLGTTFSYPYMADVLSAIFVRVGASYRDAFLIPNLVLAVSLVGVLYRWTKDLTKDAVAAALSPILLLLSGGLGWLLLFDDARKGGGGIVAVLASSAHDFTIQGDSIWRFGNAVTTLLVTQRSLLFGIPVAIVVFTLLWQTLRDDGPRTTTANRRMLGAGLIAGMLPLIHAYVFITVMVTAACLGVLFREWRDRRWRRWAIFVIAASSVALPELVWSTVGSAASIASFFGIQLGWELGTSNPITFWIANTGAFIPLVVLGLAWGRVRSVRDPEEPASTPQPAASPLVPSPLARYYLPFVLWFILPNLFRLAPWGWDDIKILFVWYVASVPIVALTLTAIARRAPKGMLVAGVLVVSLTLAGGLDIFRVVSGQTAYREYDRDGMALADAILADTPPRAIVLHAPTYNPPMYLTGRRSILGYTGYVWAHGLPYAARQRDIETMYAGGPAALSLLRQYGVTFVEVTPLERSMITVDEAEFTSFPLVFRSGAYALYAVPQP